MKKEFWFQKNVLVSGASGFLGSHLAELLLEQGANVTFFLRDYVPSSRIYESGIWEKAAAVRGELEDYFALERTMNEYEIDTVFHLGAQAIVGAANRSPLQTFKSNIEGTWNLLEAARVSGLVRRVVVASSDKAYGSQEKLPYVEETPLQGTHPYDVSKSCADLISQSYFHTYGLPVSIARCGNLYGSGDTNFNRIIPGTIQSVLLGQHPIIRSDGTYVRDYLFVKDAASAYLLLGENMHRKEIAGQAFNFSTEAKIDVLSLVKLILHEMHSDLKPVILGEATAEIKAQYLSSKKAARLLGWKARYGIEDGLRETLPWYKKHLELKGIV
ncbi:TPA: NAD-dependent epimerase/dehydratase family protein [Candidatus Micrarchaeota archaeon]|nr:NAD-dependent epimerase/dehydratase family protein [Candidatus Micrarchaeota archaeon]